MAEEAWRGDLTIEQAMTLISGKKTVKDLFDHALMWYEMKPEKVRDVLRGMGKFESAKWFEYLDKLRNHWQHVLNIKAEQIDWDKSRKEQLIDLVSKLEIVVTADGWHYTGTKEQLEAKLELDKLDREKNIARWKERYYGDYIRDSRQIEAMAEPRDSLQQGVVCDEPKNNVRLSKDSTKSRTGMGTKRGNGKSG
jgi:hypothetical protein